jgi:hypothetical protein
VLGLTAGEMGGTWIYCISRLKLTLDAELILKSYPWDTQRAYMSVESQEFTSELVTWLPAGTATLTPPGGPGSVSGWKITSTGSTTGVHAYDSLGETYAKLTYWIVVERIPDYFIVRRVVSHPSIGTPPPFSYSSHTTLSQPLLYFTPPPPPPTHRTVTFGVLSSLWPWR